MSKGQMEIFGLVLVVILIGLGLLFAVFMMSTPSETPVKESIVASNFLNTMMSTSAVGCGKNTVRDLLRDCALSGPNAFVCENGKSSCVFASEIIESVLDGSLSVWGKNYEIVFEGSDFIADLSFKSGECFGEVEAASRPEKLTSTLDYKITLLIC